MTTSFTDMFPELIEESRRLYDVFAIISSVIVFAGLCVASVNGTFGDLSRAVRGLVTAALVVILIGIFPQLTDLLQEMTHAFVIGIDADPSESHQQFARFIAGPETSKDVGFWDVLWADNGGIGKAILYAVVLLFGKFAFAVMWLATLIQNLIMLLGVAVAPIFLAMNSLEATRAIAGRYFLTLTSVVFWPFGWAIAGVVTRGILKMAAGNGIYSASEGNPIANGTEVLFLIVIVSLWMFICTIAAPFAITRLLVSGSQIGSSLLQSVGMGLSQGGSYAIGAGVTTSLAGGGMAATGVAAAAAGVGGLISGATGNSGVLLPALIGTAAVIASSKDPEQEADELAEKIRKIP